MPNFMELNTDQLEKLSPALQNKYDVVIEKFEKMVHKSSRTTSLQVHESDFMNYVSQHFYSKSFNQWIPLLPNEVQLNKAYELSRIIY